MKSSTSSQLILAKQFQDKFLDAGFQNSVLGQLLFFAGNSKHLFKSYMIRNTGLLSAQSPVGTPRSTILVYDSVYSSAGEETKSQIASMLIVEEDSWRQVSPIPHTHFFSKFSFFILEYLKYTLKK